MKILIVIPTYNERANLVKICEAIFTIKPDVHILVVDDNSPDGTGAVANDLAKKYSERLFVIQRSKKSGLGSAYLEAFNWAKKNDYDLVCQMDADGSHRPEDLTQLLNGSKTADIVIGSRRVKGGKIIGWSPVRHLISWCANQFSRFVLDAKVKDMTAGFRCLNQKAVNTIINVGVMNTGYAFQEEVIYIANKNNLTILEVPVVFIDRKYGQSKLGLNEALSFVWKIIKIKKR